MENGTLNAYGAFDDAGREYVISRPDTPLPWLNYLGQEDLFGLCTNTGGGYTFWRDARLRRLTRYRYNNLPLDLGGRYLFVNDGGAVWNPGWKPVKAPGVRHRSAHGLGYTRLEGERDGLRVEMTCFVPPGEAVELWRVAVRNGAAVRKRPRLFSFQEFCFYDAHNDATNLQRTWNIGEVEVEGSAIYHRTELRERRDHYTLFACTRPVSGFDTARDAFVGVHEGLHEARVPFAGACTGSRAFGWNPIGAHQVDLDLAPGEEARLDFLLAYVELPPAEKLEAGGALRKERGRALLARWSAPGAVDGALAALRARWDELLGGLQADCPDEHARRMVNAWNPYQCVATFNLSRSASLYETGIGRGMGFRDSNQDLLGIVHMLPERARRRILDLAATQLADGTCFHQYQPLTRQGNADVGGDFNDDPLWLVLSTCAYVKETGDASILDEPVGYADRTYHHPAGRETLLHHLELSIASTAGRRGPHGLPLIGHADWNDCLNLNCFSTEPNQSFQTAGSVAGSRAESVMIAGLLLHVTRDLAGLHAHLGRAADAARLRALREEVLAAVEAHAWDGEWYTRAWDAAGNPVGSRTCAEGQIFVESQAWCVLGGAGQRDGRARRALESVHQRLYTPHGVLLQQPAYSRYHLELGEVSSYPPGVKENGGVFCHANTWIHLGWCLLGEGDRALEYYRSICPSAQEARIETYRSEPYVYAQMIAGRDAPCAGEAKNSWLTGTAAWAYVSVSQGILGLQPDYPGLRIDPCVPRGWPGFTAVRRFRGDTYRIRVENPRGASKGVTALSLDGRPLDPSRPIPPPGDGGAHDVVAVLG